MKITIELEDAQAKSLLLDLTELIKKKVPKRPKYTSLSDQEYEEMIQDKFRNIDIELERVSMGCWLKGNPNRVWTRGFEVQWLKKASENQNKDTWENVKI